MKEVGRIYTSISAENLEVGDLVIIGNSLNDIECGCYNTDILKEIRDESYVYRFGITNDTDKTYWNLAKLVCPKKHVCTYLEWKNGAKIQLMTHSNGRDYWEEIIEPTWEEDREYRVEKIEVYSIKSEFKTQRRMKYRELAKWLAQGKGQFMYIGGNMALTSISYDFPLNTDNCFIDKNSILIRAWNEEKWHEPLVEEK